MPLQKITKEELIKRSISLFRKKGYYRTSMSDLAKACNLTKGAFYHHFKSKEEVMMQCLIVTSEVFKHKIFAIAYEKELTVQEKMDKMSSATFKAFTQNSGGCYFANTILETSHVEETFKDIMKHFFIMWEEAMMEIFSTKYPEEKSRNLSIQSITDIEGAIILMQLHNDDKYLKDALDRSRGAY